MASPDYQPGTPRTNLPTSIVRFVGRQKEIASLTSLLADPEVRLVTVVAPGGMGKTLFALEAARQNLHRFADGVYLIGLIAPTASDQLTMMIADAIGFQLQPGIPLEQQLVSFLHNRSILLLLDNSEYLAQSVPIISTILQQSPAVKILATSRIKLNLFAETLFPLGGLAYAADGASADALELFLQRAKSARFDFQLTPQEQPIVQAICELTQGMPLALVLAASWLALLSPAEILQEIRRSFDFLETDLPDVPERQRNLRSIFDFTWELLNEIDRNVLMRLSVFEGGFTRQAAQTVAQGDVRHLMNLLKTGVLQPSLSGNRYELHELLRQYATEHLRNSGEHESVMAAYTRYFLGYARQREPDIKGGSQIEALDMMQQDIENIRLAWKWATEHEQVEELEAALEAVFWYGMERTRYQLLEALFEATKQRLSHANDAATRLLLAQVDLRRWWMQRWREGATAPEAPGALETLLAIFREVGAKRDSALCLLLLGDALRTLTDDLERANDIMQLAYDSFSTLGDDYYAAWVLHFWARLTSETDGIERSFDQLNRALTLRRQRDDRFGICYSLYNLSTNLLLLGRLEECERVTREILEVSRTIGEQSTLLMAQLTAALLELLSGHFEEARKQVMYSHQLATNLNHGLGLTWATILRSILDYFDGDLASARLQTSESITGKSFLRYFVHWAAALMLQEDETVAKSHLMSALSYASRVGARGALVWCLPAQMEWEWRYGDPKQAAAIFGFIEQQPKGLLGWLHIWLEHTSLHKRIEAQLGSEAFDTAHARGRSWALETVVASLLEDTGLQTADGITIPAHIVAANRQLFEPLSERELEVLAYIGKGLSNREIADELVVELSTVKKHLTHIYGKLDVSTRAQAILRAQQLRLV